MKINRWNWTDPDGKLGMLGIYRGSASFAFFSPDDDPRDSTELAPRRVLSIHPVLSKVLHATFTTSNDIFLRKNYKPNDKLQYFTIIPILNIKSPISTKKLPSNKSTSIIRKYFFLNYNHPHYFVNINLSLLSDFPED